MAGRVKVWPVIVAFIAAIALEIVPLPGGLQPFRPPLPAMVLIYWAMMWPQRFGLGTAFIIGICLDILHGQLLGQNALSLSVIAYLTVRFHLQIRIFPLWQLTMTVFALLSIEALLQFLIEGLAGLGSGNLAWITRVLTGALIWPLLLGIMDRVRMQAENRDPGFN
jgi:rod shape-determining protein MreD